MYVCTGWAKKPDHFCRSSVAVSPFCRCKIPLFCKNHVRKFRSFTAVNSKKIRNGSGNGETATEERQRNDGNRASLKTLP